MRSSVIDNELFLTGGRDGEPFFSTYIYDGQNFRSGIDMPARKDGHCQVTVNSTHIFVTGYPTTDTFLLDWQQQKWTVLKDIPRLMYSPACGLLENPEYGPEVLVTVEDFAFIFSLTDLEWRLGSSLPEPFSDLAYAQVRDGFLAIGGFGVFEPSDKIYKFKESSYKWVLERSRLEVPRVIPAAVGVPDDFLNCS